MPEPDCDFVGHMNEHCEVTRYVDFDGHSAWAETFDCGFAYALPITGGEP